jgi:GTP-binding protein
VVLPLPGWVVFFSLENAMSDFIDETTIVVSAGAGGNGSVSFRREKFAPLGGPDGGDGGRGGSVTLVGDRNLSTLHDLRRRRHWKAEAGRKGMGSNKTGRSGEDVEIQVPLGTLIHEKSDAFADALLVDITEDGERFIVAQGGSGGAGNIRFKTSTRQVPDFAKPGTEGESREIRLSLKLLADVGLVGLPNAGKSTLLRSISRAQPRVANYPFTTLYPVLGMVEREYERFVVADIPGLIEGASDGAGLGDRFLRHIERTRVLVHLVDVGNALLEGRDAIGEYDSIRAELGSYEEGLLDRVEIVALTKVDLVSDRGTLTDIETKLRDRGAEVLHISSATREGIDALVTRIMQVLDRVDAEAEASE